MGEPVTENKVDYAQEVVAYSGHRIRVTPTMLEEAEVMRRWVDSLFDPRPVYGPLAPLPVRRVFRFRRRAGGTLRP